VFTAFRPGVNVMFAISVARGGLVVVEGAVARDDYPRLDPRAELLDRSRAGRRTAGQFGVAGERDPPHGRQSSVFVQARAAPTMPVIVAEPKTLTARDA